MTQSTPEDPLAADEAFVDAVLLGKRTRAARDAADRMEGARDAAIRKAARLGVNRNALARELGIVRSRLYVILNEPDEDDPALWEWLDEQQTIAYERWDASGQEGSVDDYWPTTL